MPSSSGNRPRGKRAKAAQPVSAPPPPHPASSPQTAPNDRHELATGNFPQVPAGNRTWLAWLIPAGLAAAMLAVLLLSVQRLSQTVDESTHLYSGYRMWKCDDFRVSAEHPPLAKLVAAVPLLAMHVPMDCAAADTSSEGAQAAAALEWLYGKDWRRILFQARRAAAIFSLGLLLSVWITARKMFGLATAALATAFLAFEPNTLAHGALVTTDMAPTCCMMLTICCYYLWTCRRYWPYLALTGVAAGLTLVAKHSGAIVVPVLLVLGLTAACMQRAEPSPSPQGNRAVRRRETESVLKRAYRLRRWRMALRNLVDLGAIFAIAAVVIWLTYFVHFTAWEQGAPPLDDAASTTFILQPMLKLHLLPQAYLLGLGGAVKLSQGKGPTYVLGNLYPDGPWFFFPLTTVIKCTLPSLLMIAAGIAGMKFLWRERRRELLFLLVTAGIFFGVCMQTGASSGIRHVLPALPFLWILGAAGAVAVGQRVRWFAYLLPCLLALHVASSLKVFPNFLTYANELWGGPAKLYRYLPNSDWGEGYDQVREYLERHPAQPCWMVTVWKMDPAENGIPCQWGGFFIFRSHGFTFPPRMTGTVIISSGYFSSTARLPGEELATFANLTPQAVLAGGSMLLFQGDFDTSGFIAKAHLLMADHLAGQPDSAPAVLQHLQQAVALSPQNVRARVELCFALANGSDLDAAQAACNAARSLVVGNSIWESSLPELEKAGAWLQQRKTMPQQP